MGRKTRLSKYFTENGIDAFIMRNDMKHCCHRFHRLNCVVQPSVHRSEPNRRICDEGEYVPIKSKTLLLSDV